MSDNTLPATAGATQALISLIMLAQQLQSEKDGIRRPDPRSTGAGAGEEPDKPAQRVQRACADQSSAGVAGTGVSGRSYQGKNSMIPRDVSLHGGGT
ncbi:hypothetical protein NRS54_004078 [Salmonella enterica]|nr:hypothetical protein [Salmonella enterica]EKJ4119301.1 hypothetical protein [Salmonella enterica]